MRETLKDVPNIILELFKGVAQLLFRAGMNFYLVNCRAFKWTDTEILTRPQRAYIETATRALGILFRILWFSLQGCIRH